MDDHGSQGTVPLPPTTRRSTKGKAPPPPTAKGLDGSRISLRLVGSPLSAMDQKENLIDKDLNLTVVLPGGVEKMATVPGSKPMMDLLVMLCAKYHLNPSGHTIELVSTNRNHIKFKPNALIGSLDAEKVLLKPKGAEEKNKKTGPQMPEATVRLVINYKKTQKTILRVNPRVPLEELMPAVCEKCEFDQRTSILLRDVRSEEPLDLTKSLNDFGLREVYARDTKSVSTAELPASPTHEVDKSLPSRGKSLKEKENKGLFSMFRKSKKKPDQSTSSAPASPVSSKQRPVSMPSLSAHTSTYSSNTMPSDVPKKRRAPLPPMTASQSFPSDLSQHQHGSQSTLLSDGDQDMSGISRGSSAESSLKRTKRKAPPPPTSPPSLPTQDETPQDGSIKVGVASCRALEGICEQEETAPSAVPDHSGVSNANGDDGRLDSSADVQMDSGKSEPAPPPADVEMPSDSPPDRMEEDHASDLSSDGKPAKDPGNEQEQPVAVEEMGAPEHTAEEEQQAGVSENGPTPEEEGQQSGSGVCSVPPGTPCPAPATQDAETLTSDQQSAVPSSEEQPEKAETPADSGLVAAVTGDAPADTPSQPVPPPTASPKPQEVPAPTEPVGLKRDMATSTEELRPQETSPPSPRRQRPPAAKSPPVYITEVDSRPKPSNELTRDYIPKVGLTTYTIVPQKSLDKLRFFEVEVTLEAPGGGVQQEVTTGPPDPQHGHAAASPPAGDSLLSNGTVTTDDTHPGNVPPAQPVPVPAVAAGGAGEVEKPSSPSKPSSPTDPSSPSSPVSPGSWGVRAELPPAQGKEKKIPPATKPKPGSFRLSQHKRTPGGYVTSAAEKSVAAVHGAGQAQAPPSSSAPPPTLPPHPSIPPPPPPVQVEAEVSKVLQGEPKPQEAKPPVAPPKITRQWSLPARDAPVGLSLEKLRTFAAPKPYTPAGPSRFAQAVSSAIRRSQSLTRASSVDTPPPHLLPGSSLGANCTIRELTEPSRSSEGEMEEEREEDMAPPPQREDPSACDPAGAGDTGDVPETHVDGKNDPPTVPDALPSVSLNGN
ncbi:cordon-bleu protein-like 1b [Megalops cyprinoides]|uniref:cordon-bleu protein-like 1b n=1 Tax=Megalops cyprinoides TaxID=118141 RepID=UPI00186403B5|nr:cordon-bleu protein-like 1b [Megalops cyprinoides]